MKGVVRNALGGDEGEACRSICDLDPVRSSSFPIPLEIVALLRRNRRLPQYLLLLYSWGGRQHHPNTTTATTLEPQVVAVDPIATTSGAPFRLRHLFVRPYSSAKKLEGSY